MEKLDVLYDHYKESNALSQSAQKQRSQYFCSICVLELLNLVFLIYPNEMVSAVSQVASSKYSVTIPIGISVIQAALWVSIVYFLVQYYQKNIYIERQYIYLAGLEKDISGLIDSASFKREGDNYLQGYPLVLDVIDFFYKWVIPVSFILINTLKIVFEYMNHLHWALTLFDTICFLFLAVLTILYLKMIHKRKN
ncbi:MAG: hypothetical protein H6Q73_2148 [Firmicutes bacterium]|nr:hypothetical protein [Bacillota bacterium]